MAKRIIQDSTTGTIKTNGDVVFLRACTVQGDLTARDITAHGRLEVLGTINAQAIHTPKDEPLVCRGKLNISSKPPKAQEKKATPKAATKAPKQKKGK